MYKRYLLISVLLVSVLFGPSFPAFAAQDSRLFFEGDMVRGGTKAGMTGPVCVLASQFKRRELIVWRIRVRDQAGKNLDASDLRSLVVKLSDGQSFPARFGPHPREKATDDFWATSWAVPADYPTGSFSYSVVATDTAGGTHSWMPFKVAPSQLTIVPGDVTFTR